MVACESFWRDVCEQRKNASAKNMQLLTRMVGLLTCFCPVVGNSEKTYGNIICFGAWLNAGSKWKNTPPKTNIEPKNWWFVDVSPFPRGYFQVPCLFSGVYLSILISVVTLYWPPRSHWIRICGKELCWQDSSRCRILVGIVTYKTHQWSHLRCW